MKVVYIAGPFRAKSAWHIEANIRRAEEVALKVAALGIIPLCPHTMYRFFQGALPDEFWLDATLELARRCDGIVMCRNWLSSVGSLGEREEMEKLNRPVFMEHELDKLKVWAHGNS